MNPKPDKTIPALYGGIIMGVISAVPFLSIINCICCAGVMLGGMLAVMFYKNNFTPDTPPFTSGDCMAVGALSGVFGAIIGSVLGTFFLVIFGNIMGEFVMQTLQNMDLNIPEEAWEGMEEGFRESASIGQFFMSLVISLILDPLFGLLGGLIGYSIFKPKHLYTPPPPMTQPPMHPPTQSF
ncbi:MAG: hypothetical protein HYZ33_00125 [Ignavibacteriales bacterium]|nr:hypothetical protein [Ignavibacteriales bacterium]